MSKRRWMPFYVADYLADTGHLSTVEHGAYLLLIMHYWQNGGLPDDDRKLARVCRLTSDEWTEVKTTLADLFDDGWRHKRIDDELAHAEHVMNKRSAAGRASAEARRNTSPSSDQHVLDQVNQQTARHQDVSVLVDVVVQDPPTIPEEASARGAPESGCRVEFSMTFWPAYPHKVGRPKALTSFIAARNRADLDVIMAGLERYVREKPPDRPWLNPATFLNQDRFNDEPASIPINGRGRPEPPHDAIFRALAKRVQAGSRRDQRPPGFDEGVSAEHRGTGADQPVETVVGRLPEPGH